MPDRPTPEPWAEDDARFSREYFANNRADFRAQCLKIRTKIHGIRPMYDNYTQRLIDRVIRQEREGGRRPQICCLKSRQVGISTKEQALSFEDAFLVPHRQAFIITDNIEHSKLMISMNRRFLRYLPKQLKPDPKDMRLENVHGLEFPWDSRIQVEPEGDAHSMTANILILDEFGYYRRPDDTLKEALPSVPKDPSSLIIMSSTANGQGNEFYDTFTEAVERFERGVHKREQGWRPVFIPWWRHEEYRVSQKEIWFTPDQTTVKEENLMDRFKISIFQIAWRRACIADIFKGDEDEFETRYPTTWQDAFKRSGRPVFPPEQMDRMLDLAPPRKNEDSVWVLSSPCEIEWDEAQKKPVIRDQSDGRLRVFRDFKPRHEYFIGADPSEGDRRSDPSPIEVLDVVGEWDLKAGKRGSIDQAAEWWGREPPDVLAKISAWLGIHYGDGKIVGEANNHGILFFATLEAMGYPNIYFRQTHEEDVSGKVTMKPGIMSTNKAKHAAIGVFRRWLREERGTIHSPMLLGEMGTTVYHRRQQTDLGNADLVTKITKPSNKTIDLVWSFAWPLFVFQGDAAAPLLPLEEKVLVSAAAQVLLARERQSPEEADQVALDLTAMTGDDLTHYLEVRSQRRKRSEANQGWAR